MRRRRRKAVDFSLQIAPVNLIDLLLIILIFFITTTTFLQLRIIELGLPESGAQSLEKTDRSMHVLGIDRNCTFYLDEAAVAPEALAQRIKSIRSADKAAQFEVGADAESPHRCFVTVIETLQRSGVQNIGILTRPEEE